MVFEATRDGVTPIIQFKKELGTKTAQQISGFVTICLMSVEAYRFLVFFKSKVKTIFISRR